MPFYVGDYIADTRDLPLEARGLWTDISVFAWKSKTPGILESDFETLSLMFAAPKAKVEMLIQMLGQMDKCLVEYPAPGLVKISVRKILSIVSKSKVLTENGLKGGNPKLKKVKQTTKQKVNQNAQPNSNYSLDITLVQKKEKGLTRGKEEDKIIMPFDSERFTLAWSAWLKYREDIKKPYKSRLSVQAALKFLSTLTEEEAIKKIETSIANSWQGLNYGDNTTKPVKSPVERAQAVGDRFDQFAQHHSAGKFSPANGDEKGSA